MTTDWNRDELMKKSESGAPNVNFNLDIVRQLRANRGQVVEGFMAGKPHLILTSVGAKTLRPRVRALLYAKYEDKYVIVGSMGGGEKNPAWYANLVAHPHAIIEVDDNTLAVHATLLKGELRDKVFEIAGQWEPAWEEFRQRPLKREIPIFLLEVLGPDL